MAYPCELSVGCRVPSPDLLVYLNRVNNHYKGKVNQLLYARDQNHSVASTVSNLNPSAGRHRYLGLACWLLWLVTRQTPASLT
ncbi:hypothetical protein EmuJ_000897400 [Echinococcus multilocularis]|uniref:Uncharacterized protein n=1 Tax=Echinococcus multilocularis TaxID=6211 RepID=A0A068YDF6_ECHMU|nr:hypothetical protein EmuJ_000897400 [Echinococcus multilocularis]